MRQTTVTLLVILAATLVASWWFTSFEKTTRSEYVGLSGEARYNDYFAAEALLKELDIEADGVATLSPNTWLPTTDDTLVLTIDEVLLVEGAELDVWVQGGGHLVILPGPDFRALERFLGGSLGAKFAEVEIDYDLPSEDVEDEPVDDMSEVMPFVTWGSLRVELEDDSLAVAAMKDDYGITVARLLRGQGVVTLVAGSWMFSNMRILEPANASLLLDIVDGYYDPGKVWFVYSNSFDSLLAYIWKMIPLTVIALAIALVLWLLTVLPRFGPPIRPMVRDRRSLIEHISAAGTFEWKHAERDALASSAISLLLHTAERRHPGIGRLPLRDQANRLASITGIPAQEIADALATIDGHTPRGFTRHMQILQETRDRL